jgi:hypothetical protein
MTPKESVPAKAVARSRLLAGVERHLSRTGAPRALMILLVSLTGLVGLLTSICLLHLHLEIIALRRKGWGWLENPWNHRFLETTFHRL